MSHAKYTDSKTEYVNTMVVPEDRERMQEQISLPRILEKFRTAPRFSVTFLRDLPSGPRYYRIDIGKIEMSDDRTGVAMGFLDVDEDIRKEQTYTKVLHDARKAKEENRRLMEEVQSAAKLADLMASASSLLTNMPAMSFSKDAKTGKYLACNQAFADYAGKSSPEAVVGLTDYEIFDPGTAILWRTTARRSPWTALTFSSRTSRTLQAGASGIFRRPKRSSGIPRDGFVCSEYVSTSRK